MVVVTPYGELFKHDDDDDDDDIDDDDEEHHFSRNMCKERR